MTFPSDTHTAIIGSSGAGKTVTAKVEVEALLTAERHLCIIDPTGVWYGLRSNAAGDGPGFNIPIFGGEHGDVPVLPEQGEAVGKIIADGVSAIVDVSGMDSREQRRFVRGLLTSLRKKAKANFHLIVDEADEFAPQTAPDDIGFDLTEQMKWVAKRGRVHGFVLTVITQRPADINKGVLSQMQTIIAHQLVAPQDQKAIDDYLKANGDAAVRKDVMQSLPGLARGERWIYSPRLDVLERGVTPMPVTFDSSRTPEPGDTPAAPKMLAQIDLGAIRAALAPTADANSGAPIIPQNIPDCELSAEIGQLRAQITALQDEHAIEIATGQQHLDFLCAALGQIRRVVDAALTSGAFEQPGVLKIDPIYKIPAQGGGGPTGDDGRTEGHQVMMSATPRAKPQRQRPQPQGVTAGETATELNAAARKMVDMLDRIAPARVPWGSLAAMIGNKARGGNFNAARKAMRESGLIVEDGETVRSARPAQSGMTREQAFELWEGVLSNPAPRMMDALIDGGLSKVELGERLGIVPRGGNFNNGIAQLVRNGVIVERAGVLHLADPLPGQSE